MLGGGEGGEARVPWRLAGSYGEAGFSSLALLVLVACTFVCWWGWGGISEHGQTPRACIWCCCSAALLGYAARVKGKYMRINTVRCVGRVKSIARRLTCRFLMWPRARTRRGVRKEHLGNLPTQERAAAATPRRTVMMTKALKRAGRNGAV